MQSACAIVWLFPNKSNKKSQIQPSLQCQFDHKLNVVEKKLERSLVD